MNERQRRAYRKANACFTKGQVAHAIRQGPGTVAWAWMQQRHEARRQQRRWLQHALFAKKRPLASGAAKDLGFPQRQP